MYMKYSCTAVAVLGSFFCTLSFADEAVKIAPIVVEGSSQSETSAGPVDGYIAPTIDSASRTRTPLKELPQSVSVVPRTVIEDQQNLSISESLKNVSGVVTNHSLYTPASDATRIRGFAAEQLVDGFTQYYNPGDRQSLVNVERLEVLKGANGVLYGGGSGTPVGGVVNIVSKKPEKESFGEVGVKVGSDRFVQPYFDVNQPITETVLFRLSAEYTNSESHIDVIETDRYNINSSLTFTDNDKTTFTLLGKLSRWSQQEYQGLPATGTVAGNFSIDPDLFIGPSDIPDSKSRQQSITAIFERELNDIWHLDVRARLSSSEFDEKAQTIVGADGFSADTPALAPSTWSLVNAQLFQEQIERSVQVNADAKFGEGNFKGKFLVGADYSWLSDEGFIDTNLGGGGSGVVDLTDPSFPAYTDPGPGINNQFVDNVTYGLHTQVQATVYERLHLLAGARIATVGIDFSNTSTGVSSDTEETRVLPRIGATFDVTDRVSVFAAYSEGMRGQPFQNFVSAPEPERSKHYEAGLKVKVNSQLSGQFAVYQIDRSNVAVTDNTDPFFRSVAEGKQKSLGVELDVTWQPVPDLKILASYAYTDAKLEDALFGVPEGNSLPVVPEHSGRIWVNYDFNSNWSGGVGLYAQSEAYLSNNNSFKSDAYHTMDATLSYHADAYRLSASIKNLTNQEYFEAYNYFGGRVIPAAGTSLYLNASYLF
ncbi:MAG: TonB-dependent siderophore receptor [Sneathiellales bacterium]|nr:TonB-dependent siderophore receptor [Sneathiellales bacterium]